MDISIPNIWQRVGTRVWQVNTGINGLVGALADVPLTLVLSWPDSRPYHYLNVQAKRKTAAEAAVGAEPALFLDTLDSARRMIAARNLPTDAIPAAILKRRNHLLIADVAPGDVISLEFMVDTDAVQFLDDADDAEVAGQAFVREIEVYAIPDAPSAPAHGVIYLALAPARMMARYDGYVALDLGNTNSTLVCLAASGHSSADDIEVVRVELGTDAKPVASAVRILRFSPSEDPELMDEATWLVGEEALVEGQGGDLILGAKRLLADADPEARLVFTVDGQRRSVSKEFAAELFVCKLFRSFHERKFNVPMSIAITHPTTFSSREVDQLRQAFLRGWRRSNAAELPAKSNDECKNIKKPIPAMVIDEASAAAMYFLWRDFADQPGGPDVMKYLYPDGLNLLVFDCGGGTTDIALIQARVAGPPTARPQNGGKTAWIEIEVLGRTGNRNFGGDDITVAAYRILKARLAEKLSPGRLRFPDTPSELKSFLASKAREIDQIVPTNHHPENLSLDGQAARRDATNWLWKWAERFKIETGQHEGRVKAKHGDAQSYFLSRLSPDETKNRNAVNSVEMDRREIDALIHSDLDRCLDYANQMIGAKLGRSAASGPGEVHCAYVVGNASKYPLIAEMIRSKLRVPFIDQKLGEVHGGDLKDSVAKGAVFALQSQDRQDTLGIRFDSQLADKIPFEITFTDRAEGRVRSLYREHESYNDLTERRIPVPEPSRDAQGPHFGIVYLGRRWPGDPKPADYLKFPFKEAITGPLTVWYERDQFRFFMRDETSGEEVAGEEFQKAAFRAPVQSGLL